MIRTKLSSESRRMCSRHPERPAIQLRRTVEQARGPKYTVTRAECDTCSKKSGGVVSRLST